MNLGLGTPVRRYMILMLLTIVLVGGFARYRELASIDSGGIRSAVGRFDFLQSFGQFSQSKEVVPAVFDSSKNALSLHVSPMDGFSWSGISGLIGGGNATMQQSAKVHGPVKLSMEKDRAEGMLECDVVLNLFTTFIDNGDNRKIGAQENVLRAYQRLRKHGVMPWLFTTSEKWTKKAMEHDVMVVSDIATNRHGTPLLGHMYETVRNITEKHCTPYPRYVFDSYTNGDIVFTKGLADTLSEVRRVWGHEISQGRRKGVMVIGKRTNVDYFDTQLKSDAEVEEFSKKGHLFQNDAIDYFAYLRGTVDWNRMPKFAVGRRAYDNWLVDNMFHKDEADMIDATHTVLALHLTASDGNLAGHKKGVDNDWNKQVINPVTRKQVGGHEWDHGRTDHAQFFTRWDIHDRVAFHLRSGRKEGRSMPELATTLTPETVKMTPSVILPTAIRAPAPSPDASKPKDPVPLSPRPVTIEDIQAQDNKDNGPHFELEPCKVVLNLFTTFIENSHDNRKQTAQENVLRSYQRLREFGIQPWLFSRSEDWTVKAMQHDVKVVSQFETNPAGTPYLGSMYRHIANITTGRCGDPEPFVFDAYVNGDIVFTRSLADTLIKVRSKWEMAVRSGRRKGVMIVGKRTNVECPKGLKLHSDKAVEKFSQLGRVFQNNAQDFFIYSRGAVNWDQIPAFVVGRRAYDNWLVHNAHHDPLLDLIDASNTILAVHLTASDGNSAGHKKGVDNNWNVQVMNPVTKRPVNGGEWSAGTTDHAHFFTRLHAGEILFHPRSHQAKNRTVPENR